MKKTKLKPVLCNVKTCKKPFVPESRWNIFCDDCNRDFDSNRKKICKIVSSGEHLSGGD